MKITINNLTSSGTYDVASELSPNRVIINYEGIFVLADLDASGAWQLSGTPPTPEENAVLMDLIEKSGTLDNTVVVVEPPDGN